MTNPKRTMMKDCRNCGKAFLIPACRNWREHDCSSACKAKSREKRSALLRAIRTRNCELCGIWFVAKKSQIDAGEGRFCSLSCSAKSFSATDEFRASRLKSAATFKESLASGKFTPMEQPKGAESPYWKGGLQASKQRMKDAGKTNAARKANPEKYREYAHRRSGRKVGRLPRGTVKELIALQRNRCAICKCSVTSGYHVDHVMPLALGGTHEKGNIQILCPTCNVRKNAKHPIRYAQELGMLL